MAGGCARSADAAAYALGALDPGEAQEFRAHVQTCAACRDDVAAFQGVTRGLPDASTRYAVPKGLRKRVLNEVRATPQDGSPAPATRRRVLIPRRAFGALAGAAAVAVAVVIGIAIGSSGGGSPTRVIQAQVIGAPGSAKLQVTGGRGELVLRGLPAPGLGRIYEVWFERGRGRPSPTNTLFSVSSAGAGDVGLAGSLTGIGEVLVTSEPAGGSRVPTSPALIVARLT